MAKRPLVNGMHMQMFFVIYFCMTGLHAFHMVIGLGIAGSLDQAIKQGTSDMARWLESDYRLTSPEAAYVLGFANVYDVPDMVPPFVGVSSRVPKKSLPKPQH